MIRARLNRSQARRGRCAADRRGFIMTVTTGVSSGVESAYLPAAIMIGVGATLILDLWALFLKRVLHIPSSSYCLLGRWLLHMPEGTFTHASIAAARQINAECVVGWIAHYATGVVFAVVLLALVSADWVAQPTPLPALLFGIGTVLLPYLVMQPALGLGVAASKAPKPTQARLKSLMTHVVFGLGLYLSAVGVSHVLGSLA